MSNASTRKHHAFMQYLRDNYSEHEWNKKLDEYCQSGEYPQDFLDHLTDSDTN